MIGHQRDHDTCSGVELVLAALLSQAYAAFSKVRSVFSDTFVSTDLLQMMTLSCKAHG
jgi:hypothetical protein